MIIKVYRKAESKKMEKRKKHKMRGVRKDVYRKKGMTERNRWNRKRTGG